MDNTVLCKDCKHAFRAWYDILFTSSKRHTMRCRKSFKEAHAEVDLVIGSVHRAEHYELCGIARLTSGACGKEGKMWEPSDPKKFFVYLKRV